jgi:electron transfer flavoprotein beta subunit
VKETVQFMAYSIVVLVKQVPDPNGIRVDQGSGSLQLSGQMAISSFDDYAIEAALQLQETHGGEVTAVSVGPSSARNALTRALAMGADKAVLVSVENSSSLDSLALARVIAAAVKPLAPDIVLAGQMSDDFGTGEIGPQVAELLGFAQVSSATSIEASGSTLTIRRDTEYGKQVIEADTPVVIMAMTGLNEPRYPSLKGIMAAKKKPLEVVSPDSVPVSLMTWSEPFVQERQTEGVVIHDVPPAEAAKQFVAWLRDQKLIG